MAQGRTASRSNRGITSSSTRGRGDPAVLGASVRIRGRISGDGDLTILGNVEGNVSVRGDLVVGEGATVNADAIEGHAITLGGDVTGAVSASGRVHVTKGANVKGDVKGESIAIDEGANFSGRLDADFELPPELSSSGKRSR